VRSKRSKAGAKIEMGQGSSTEKYNLSMEYVPFASKSIKAGPSSAKTPKVKAVKGTSYAATDASAEKPSNSVKITPRSIGISEQTEQQVSEANESEASGATTRLAAVALSIMVFGTMMTIVV
jgi:hypothetical protein